LWNIKRKSIINNMNFPSKRLMLVQIFVIFVLPIILLYFKIIPSNWRIILLLVSSLFIYGIIRHEKWTHEEMGVRNDNFKKAFPFYLFFTVLSLITLFIISKLVHMPQEVFTKMFYFKTVILFLPSSFFQEFAFRSFLMPRLKHIFQSSFTIILINAVLFTFMHVIYSSLGILIPILFISGIFFAWLYFKYPNLILVSIAHSFLNVTAVLLGFFVIR